jgi:metal-dependent amidase/aminoacylase/carboxypeptidase family protein
MKLGSDIDLVAEATEAQVDDILKKYIATKNVKPDTALRWALQRAMDEASREKIRKKMQEYYQSQAGLID